MAAAATASPASPLCDALMSDVDDADDECVLASGKILVGRGNPDHLVDERPSPRLYLEFSDSSDGEDAGEETAPPPPPPSAAPREEILFLDSDGDAEVVVTVTPARKRPIIELVQDDDDVKIVGLVAAPSADERKAAAAAKAKKDWEDMYRIYANLVDLRNKCGGQPGDYGAADMERLQRLALQSFSQPARRSITTARMSSVSAQGGAHARPVQPPSDKEMEGWAEYSSAFLFLDGIQPPTTAEAEALCVDLKDAERYRNKTEPLGVYLIERGFPLIGKGRHTLVFLLNATYVAKVAKYRADHKEKGCLHMYEKHISERNLDVAFYRDYPTCSAETRYVRVNLLEKTYESCYMYVQERLTRPFYHGGLDPDEVRRDENGWMIAAMIVRNQGAYNINQWGLTRVRKHTLIKADGTQEECERRWLVRFDNE